MQNSVFVLDEEIGIDTLGLLTTQPYNSWEFCLTPKFSMD